MDTSGINFIALVVAAAASFGFGALYYTVLAKPWMAAVGTTENEIKQTRSATPFITSIAALLVMSFVLAGHFAQHGADSMTAGHAVESAVMLWLGFILTSMAVNNAFQGAKTKLTVIDSAHWLGVLVIQGLVLNAFGA